MILSTLPSFAPWFRLPTTPMSFVLPWQPIHQPMPRWRGTICMRFSTIPSKRSFGTFTAVWTGLRSSRSDWWNALTSCLRRVRVHGWNSNLSLGFRTVKTWTFGCDASSRNCLTTKWVASCNGFERTVLGLNGGQKGSCRRLWKVFKSVSSKPQSETWR